MNASGMSVSGSDALGICNTRVLNTMQNAAKQRNTKGSHAIFIFLHNRYEDTLNFYKFESMFAFREKCAVPVYINEYIYKHRYI